MIDAEEAFVAGRSFKEGLRRALREILVCCVLTGVPFSFYLDYPGSNRSVGEFLMLSAFTGLFTGPIAWLIYRILRFAIGR